ALLYALTPALVLLIGVARGTERFTRGGVVGIVLALSGVSLVLVDAGLHKATVSAAASAAAAHQGANENQLYGDLMILGGVVAWAVLTAFARGGVGRLGALLAPPGEWWDAAARPAPPPGR